MERSSHTFKFYKKTCGDHVFPVVTISLVMPMLLEEISCLRHNIVLN